MSGMGDKIAPNRLTDHKILIKSGKCEHVIGFQEIEFHIKYDLWSEMFAAFLLFSKVATADETYTFSLELEKCLT